VTKLNFPVPIRPVSVPFCLRDKSNSQESAHFRLPFYLLSLLGEMAESENPIAQTVGQEPETAPRPPVTIEAEVRTFPNLKSTSADKTTIGRRLQRQ
jgi:hypothetical protein